MASAIDTVLDRTIALGYGDVGLHVRRHLPGWPADPPRLDGKVVVVTGAASGIGLAACRGFAQLGASVRAVARDERRAEDAVRQIREAAPTADVRGLGCDVASLRSLRSLAERLSAEEEQLDVLVNNAGTMPDQRERSPDGHEVVIMELWAERLAPRRIVVHAMHPGWVDTKGVREWLPVFRAVTGSIIRSPDEGADTIVWLGGAPDALKSTGRFWHDRRARPTHYLLGASDDDPRDRRRLWDVCQLLIES